MEELSWDDTENLMHTIAQILLELIAKGDDLSYQLQV
jgi:hypothetical protein